MGLVYGIIDKKTVHLNSLVLENQTIMLIDKIEFPKFRDKKVDGMLGLSTVFSPLHTKTPFFSVVEGIKKLMIKDNVNERVLVIMKLGGGYPYIKIYYLEELDYYHIAEDEYGKKETIYWIRLFDKTKMMLALRNITFKYYDGDKLISEKNVLDECHETGCRALIDTKSYFIYGPGNAIQPLTSLSASCGNYYSLPDITFSFFDVNAETKGSTSTVHLTIKPDEYMISDGSDSNCKPGVIDHGTDYGWNFGIMFLKPFMVMYDFNGGHLGFVRIR